MLKVAVDENELSRRRRVVYLALTPYLPEARVMEALWIWEERFARGSAFAFHDFVALVCDTPALKHLRGDIHRALVKSMTRDLSELGPEPWPKMRAARMNGTVRRLGKGFAPTPVAQPVPSSDGTVVFGYVLGLLLDELHNLHPEHGLKVRMYLLERLPALGLTSAEVEQMKAWLVQQEASLGGRFSPVAMRGILHLAYVLACDYFGPTCADKLLAAGIKSAESLPQARRYAPRELL